MEKKQEIIEKIRNFLEKREEIIFAYVFGSFISDEKYNDIDVGIYMREIGKIDVIDYSISLSIEMEKIIKKKIDVKVMNDLPVPLNYHITKGLLLFTKNQNIYEDFVCRVWKEYVDFKYLSNIYIKELKNARI